MYEENMTEALLGLPGEKEFINRLDFELFKTLNNIITVSELVLNTADYSEKTEMLNQIIDASKSLEYIVEEIKKSSGLIPVSLFYLDDVLNSVMRFTKSQIEKRGLTFRINRKQTLPGAFIGNGSQLGQVLVTLIKNSADYTASGGITVTAEEQERSGENITLLFGVSDTGAGMTEEQINMLFPKIPDNTQELSVTGKKSGIALCRSLINIMGGKIWCESIMGKGTTVYFTVQCKIPPKTEKPDKTYRVLIVDDDAVIQTVSCEILKRNNFISVTADGGVEAIEKIKSEPHFDVVLMDIYMPDMDGLTASKMIREIEEYKDTPIIALTANSYKGDKDACFSNGMNDFITKPYDASVFVKTVRSWAEKAVTSSPQ